MVRMFITVFTKARHETSYSARYIQYNPVTYFFEIYLHFIQHQRPIFKVFPPTFQIIYNFLLFLRFTVAIVFLVHTNGSICISYCYFKNWEVYDAQFAPNIRE